MMVTQGRIPAPPEVEAERVDMDRVIGGQSVVSQFLATVRRQPTDISLRSRIGVLEGGWTEITWTEYADRAARVGTGLAALGVEPGDRVAMLLRNRPEFHYTDMGSLLIRATPVSIYNSSAPAQIKYLLGHSAAKVVVCENDDFASRVLKVRDQLPALKHVVVIEASSLDGVMQFSAYSAVGASWHPLVENAGRHIVRVVQECRRRGATCAEVTDEATDREHAEITRALRTSLFNNRDCSTANTYYIDHHGDAPILRPVTVPRARRESLTFPLDAYCYTTTSGARPLLPETAEPVATP